MQDKMKHAYRLYHITFIPKGFKLSIIIEFAFWFLLGYYFCFQNANLVGVSIGNQEPIISIGIKILTPVVIFTVLLGYTQCHIYNFLNEDKCVVLYKMFPNSFENFRQNLNMTYRIACPIMMLLCVLYMVLFAPTFMILSIYEFSLMLPVSAYILYVGLTHHNKDYLIIDMVAIPICIAMSIACLILNELLYSYMALHIICAIIFLLFCIMLTHKILQKLLSHMKGAW